MVVQHTTLQQEIELLAKSVQVHLWTHKQTIPDLAYDIGVHHQVLRDCLHNRRHPSLRLLVLISKAVGHDYKPLVHAWIETEIGERID